MVRLPGRPKRPVGAFAQVPPYGPYLEFLGAALQLAGLGIGIFRFRLWDIDRLINRTLVYGLLTAILGLCYAAGSLLFVLVAGAGSDPPSWLVAAATLAAAAVFRPSGRPAATHAHPVGAETPGRGRRQGSCSHGRSYAIGLLCYQHSRLCQRPFSNQAGTRQPARAVLPSRRFRDHAPTSGIGQANRRPLLCLPIEPAPPGHQISVGHHLLPTVDGRLGATSGRPPAHGTLAPQLGEVIMVGPGRLDLTQQLVIGPTSGQVVTDQRRRSGRKLLAVGTARRPRPIAIKAADSLVQRRELVDDPPDLRAGHLRVLATESTVQADRSLVTGKDRRLRR